MPNTRKYTFIDTTDEDGDFENVFDEVVEEDDLGANETVIDVVNEMEYPHRELTIAADTYLVTYDNVHTSFLDFYSNRRK